MPKHSIERTNPNVMTVRFSGIGKGWEQWVRLSSDHHYDNLHCDRTLLKQHLDKMMDREAIDLTHGDIFCAMQGRYDPRRSLRDVRDEHKVDNYLDAIVEDAAEFYGPYAKNMVLLSMGNHEATILKNNGISLLSNLAFRLNTQNGGHVAVGEYSGWVRFMFEARGSYRQSYRMYYHHGSGGGGPVTRGVIQTNRQAVYLPDADMVVNGHTHDAWVVPVARDRLSNMGNPYTDVAWYIRTASYKREYGTGGWADQTWKPPKPAGCAWLRFYYHVDKIEVEAYSDVV